MGASPIPTERTGYFHPTKCEQPGGRVQPSGGLCLQISRLTNVLPHSALDPIEAHRGRPQSQAAALRAEEAFIDRVEDGHHKEQEKEHPEGQDKQIGRQRSDPDRTEGEETDSRAIRYAPLSRRPQEQGTSPDAGDVPGNASQAETKFIRSRHQQSMLYSHG